MKLNMLQRKQLRAFTLIELLVVIGIIGALATGIGLMLKDGNPGASLKAGQGLVVSTLAAARGQAALAQANTEILVEADNVADEGFLRRIIVVINSTTQVGGDILLPRGAYVVPSMTIGNVTKVEADGAGSWPTECVSTFFGSRSPRTINGVSKQYLISTGSLTPLGTLSGISGGKIVIGGGRLKTATEFEFSRPDSARGVLVSSYGVATLINDVASFK
jgi:prepilin-type N-terminal cleavage/methylation domain-containing protein